MRIFYHYYYFLSLILDGKIVIKLNSSGNRKLNAVGMKGFVFKEHTNPFIKIFE